MTLIVAFKKDNKTIIAGDKMGSNGLTHDLNKQPKIFTLKNKKDTFLVGYTSSFRFGQIIENMFSVPENHDDLEPYMYMVQKFIPEFRKALEQNKYSSGDEKGTSGVCIVVMNDRIFRIQADYSVLENINDYCAVGCGEYHATSLLDFFTNEVDFTPEKSCDIIFKTVSKHVQGVSKEHDILVNI